MFVEKRFCSFDYTTGIEPPVDCKERDLVNALKARSV
jgi:hypothetical protein